MNRILPVFCAVALLCSSTSLITAGTTSVPGSDQELTEAREAFAEQRYDQAEEIIDSFLAENGKDPDGVLLKADILYRQDQPKAALSYLSAFITRHPKEPIWRYVRGKFLLDHGYRISAEEDLLQAEQAQLNNFDLFVLLATIYSAADKQRAIAYLDKALKINADYAEIWHRKYTLENTDLKAAKRAWQLEPQVEEYLVAYAESLIRKQDFATAQNLLAEGVGLFPENTFLLNSLVHISAGSPKAQQRAYDIFQQLISAHAGNTQARVALALLEIERKRYQEGIQALQSVLTLKPKDTTAHSLMAKILWFLKRYDQAIPHLEELSAVRAFDPFIYHKLSQYYNHNNRPDKAELAIFRGLQLFSRAQKEADRELLFQYAVAQEKRRNYQESEKVYRLLLQKEPKQYQTRLGLGRSLFLQRHIAAAKQELQQAIARGEKKDTLEAWYLLGKVYTEEENFRQAISVWDTLLEHLPESGELHRYKAASLMRLKQYPQALTSINKALALQPSGASYELEGDILFLQKRYALAEKSYTHALNLEDDTYYIRYKIALSLFRDKNAKAGAYIADMLKRYQPSLELLELHFYLSGKWKALWQLTPADEMRYTAILFDTEGQEQPVSAQDPEHAAHFWVLASRLSLFTTDSPKPEFSPLPSGQHTPKARAWHLLYRAYWRHDNNPQEFADLLRQAVQLDPQNPWLAAFLGEIEFDLKNYQAATTALQKFYNFRPDNLWVQTRLALSYSYQQLDSDSQRMYLDILKHDPENALALNNLAWLYLTAADTSLRNTDAALKLARQAVQITPSAANLDTLSEALYQKGEYTEALDLIERAILLDLENLDHYKTQKRKIEQAAGLSPSSF